MTSRRSLLRGASAAGLLTSGLLPTLAPFDVRAETSPDGRTSVKTLRYAFLVAETSLDPVKLSDLYSRTLTPHIFEALYGYDHLARPIKIKPRTAAAMPEVSSDFRVWTIRIKPGIFFAADEAFKGKKRELVAQDYAYAFMRFADPANKSPAWSEVETFQFVGLNELRAELLAARKPFDYDRPVEGLKVLDAHTIRFTLKESRPRFIENLCGGDLYGAVAREVVEFYGDTVDAHPVGTGPYKLVQWRRSSRIVFERNPDFRELYYDAEPAADDAEGQAMLARFKGRRLPMIDRVEISVIEDSQPRWLSFVAGEADFMERIPASFINIAMPGGKVAPNLAKRGVRGYRQVEPGTTYVLFNLDDPIVGGYTPEKVALRRAIGLAIDKPQYINVLSRGQAITSESPISPFTTGYDPKFKSEMGEFDPGRANALLDIYGYADRNGDGFREMPDGSPLVVQMSTQADQSSRQFAEMLTKNMKSIGIRLTLKVAQWPENLKSAQAGSFMAWSLGGLADVPDGISAIARYDSRQIGGQNMSRFRNAGFDKMYDRMLELPDGPERDALFLETKRLAVAYMPYKMMVSRIITDMSYPWFVGYRRPVFWLDWWHYVDIDTAAMVKT
jgi:ABC-type transport system substrate-binding protein